MKKYISRKWLPLVIEKKPGALHRTSQANDVVCRKTSLPEPPCNWLLSETCHYWKRETRKSREDRNEINNSCSTPPPCSRVVCSWFNLQKNMLKGEKYILRYEYTFVTVESVTFNFGSMLGCGCEREATLPPPPLNNLFFLGRTLNV